MRQRRSRSWGVSEKSFTSASSMAIILLAFVQMQLLIVKLPSCNDLFFLAGHFHLHPLRKPLVPRKLVEILGSALLEASLGESSGIYLSNNFSSLPKCYWELLHRADLIMVNVFMDLAANSTTDLRSNLNRATYHHPSEFHLPKLVVSLPKGHSEHKIYRARLMKGSIRIELNADSTNCPQTLAYFLADPSIMPL